MVVWASWMWHSLVSSPTQFIGYNVALTSMQWRWIDVNAMLYKRHAPLGYICIDKSNISFMNLSSEINYMHNGKVNINLRNHCETEVSSSRRRTFIQHRIDASRCCINVMLPPPSPTPTPTPHIYPLGILFMCFAKLSLRSIFILLVLRLYA